MTVVRLPVRGQWAWDVRGEGRAVRISAHVEAGLVNLSVWRHDTCVGTVRLLPDEVANLVAGLTEGLAQMAVPPALPSRGPGRPRGCGISSSDSPGSSPGWPPPPGNSRSEQWPTAHGERWVLEQFRCVRGAHTDDPVSDPLRWVTV